MILNDKCKDCSEPTKLIAGCYDGINTSGFLFDCENTNCHIKQLAIVCNEKAAKEREEIRMQNEENRVDIVYLKARRKEAGIYLGKMANIVGCNTAQYSAYESEREAFEPGVYRKCIDYLDRREALK